METDIIPEKIRRTASKEVRVQQLIDATQEVLAEKGIAGATMAMITSRAELSMGIVSLHFQSKENLLKSTLRYLSEEISDTYIAIFNDHTLSAIDRLQGIVNTWFDSTIATPIKIATWFAFFGDAHYRNIYREIAKDLDDDRVDAIVSLCAEIIAEGGYEDVDASSVAISIECLCDGLWINMMLYPERLKPAQAQKVLTDLIARNFPKHINSSV